MRIGPNIIMSFHLKFVNTLTLVECMPMLLLCRYPSPEMGSPCFAAEHIISVDVLCLHALEETPERQVCGPCCVLYELKLVLLRRVH